MKRLVWIIAAAAGLAMPAYAHAANAFLTADAPLMAGPDEQYPQVDQLEAGSEVTIQGCTDGWEWCDVVAYGERGWVPGDYLEYQYENQWVLVPEYAPRLGVPIVVFSISNYWDTYYRGRPFYLRRWDWYRWHPPYRQHPRPVDFPPPHPWHGPPPVHHPVDYPPPYHGKPPPHPVDYPPPYHHGNPPPRVMPMPHPTPNPPPRVVPMPHPTPNTAPAPKPPRDASDAKDKSQQRL